MRSKKISSQHAIVGRQVFFFSLFTVCCLLFTFFPACGKRGALKMPAPYSPGAASDSPASAGPVEPLKTDQIRQPEAPSGLTAVYMQSGVVLVWNPPRSLGAGGHLIKAYRIYRSEGGDFKLIGESVTPAFTDRDVVPTVRYHYRVSAVGETEGLPSQEVVIITKIH